MYKSFGVCCDIHTRRPCVGRSRLKSGCFWICTPYSLFLAKSLLVPPTINLSCVYHTRPALTKSMFQTKACSLVSSRLCGANLLFLSLLYFEWKAAHIQNSIARMVLRVPQRTCFTEQIKWSSVEKIPFKLSCLAQKQSTTAQLPIVMHY